MIKGRTIDLQKELKAPEIIPAMVNIKETLLAGEMSSEIINRMQ